MEDAAYVSSEPFREFARHYDQFMLRYVDYKAWADYVERIFKRFKGEPKTVLDLACGTGIPTVLMAKRGFVMTGVDRSAEMLAILREKSAGLPIRVVQADIREFELDAPVDAAICLYDSINYLLSVEDLERCFRSVRRAVLPGGPFVFDVNTLYSLSSFWGDRITPRKVGNLNSIWQNSYDQETRTSTLHLTFWEEREDGTEPVRFEEIHKERAYSRQELTQVLAQTGFGKARFYNHGGFLPVGPLTTRMMVVAD